MTERLHRTTNLGLSAAEGIASLEAIIERARRTAGERSPKELAAELWPDFKIAVAAAIAENADDHAAGGRRWLEGRHL